MKILYINSGMYAGEHEVYESVEEFRKELPQIEPKRWTSMDIETNDWVITDDSCVIQCLKRFEPKDKRNKYRRIFFRFPFMTAYYWWTVKQGWKFKNLYGIKMEKYKDFNSIGAKKMEDKAFILYVRSGYSFREAYIKAMNNTRPTERLINRMIEKNKEQLMKELSSLANNVNDRVKAITGKTIWEIVEDKVVDIASKLNTDQMSLKETRENIRFLAQITASKNKEILAPNAEFIEEGPPPLGKQNDN